MHSLTEDGHLGEELLVEFSLPHGGAHEDPAVGVPVDPPQLDVRVGGLDGGRARGPVDQGQLAETAPVADGQDFLAVHQDLRLKFHHQFLQSCNNATVHPPRPRRSR